MDPIAQFKAERKDTLASYSSDVRFQDISQDWLKEAMEKRYVYNFDWLGRPIIQFPQDVFAIQELVWTTRPDVIIETGIAHGGSLILSASLLALLDYCDAVETGTTLDTTTASRRVIGVDIDIRKHNRAAIEAHPMSNKIKMVEGSSIDADTLDRVRELVGEAARVMVCLDSNHTHDHVLSELNAYTNFVTPGSYCVVFDTFIEDMPQGFIKDRPWDKSNNPKTAVHEWLSSNSHFAIDREIETKLMVTGAPSGFLKRVG
ncbi:MAG: cephalosporin hydroxylase family protein [Pseudomonadota bacterium]